MATDEVCAALRLDTDGSAVLERQLQIADDLARERERQRLTDRPLGAARVGRREDLLGRHVRDVGDPARGRRGARLPADVGKQSHRQVRARPAIAERVGLELVQLRRPRLEPSEVLVPGGCGVWLVEAHAERNGFPQALDVRLSEHLARPLLPRRADADPVDRVLAHLLHPYLHDLLRHCSTDALAVEVGKEIRLRIAGRGDQRVAGDRGDEVLQPPGRIGQSLVRAELDHRSSRVHVAVEHVHVGRAGAVGLARDGSREIVMLDGREEEDLLTRLDVRAHPDGELGVALEAFVHCKDPMQNSA